MNHDIEKLVSLYFFLFNNFHIEEAQSLRDKILDVANRGKESFAASQIASNVVKNSDNFDESVFFKGMSREEYKEVLIPLYFKDISSSMKLKFVESLKKEVSKSSLAGWRHKDILIEYIYKNYPEHYEEDKRNIALGNPISVNLTEEDISNISEDWFRLEENIERCTFLSKRSAEKTINSHVFFVNKLIDMGIDPSAEIISPGSGFSHEQALFPDRKFRGLEYQEPLVDMANRRNSEMGIDNSTNERWSLTRFNPDEVLKKNVPVLGEDWENMIETIHDNSGNIGALYLKHACGGLTDGVLLNAVNMKIPFIFIATCCSDRYTEISWRVLSPKDENQRPMSFMDYSYIARRSQNKRSQEGIDMQLKIDKMRKEFLVENGYSVELGRSEEFGPYIKAKL